MESTEGHQPVPRMWRRPSPRAELPVAHAAAYAYAELIRDRKWALGTRCFSTVHRIH